MRAILLVGMNRSGTSCLTRCWRQAGLELGEVITWAPHNPRGNHEACVVMALNERVLRESGATRDAPPESVAWSDSARAQRDAHVCSVSRHECWDFKDRRTLLTPEGWLESLPRAVTVGTYRHPETVARSLAARSGRIRDRAILLWEAYNARLLARHRCDGTALICFDWHRERYAQRLAEIACRLGLPAPQLAAQLHDAKLRNHDAESEVDLPEDVSGLWRQLHRHAESMCD